MGAGPIAVAVYGRVALPSHVAVALSSYVAVSLISLGFVSGAGLGDLALLRWGSSIGVRALRSIFKCDWCSVALRWPTGVSELESP